MAFYHAQAGGCCDCGDPDAWDPKGFCPKHGVGGGVGQEGLLGADVEDRVRGVVVACSEWLEGMLGRNVERGYERGKGIVRMEGNDGMETVSIGGIESAVGGGSLDIVFNPNAASTSKSRSTPPRVSSPPPTTRDTDSSDVVMVDINDANNTPTRQVEQHVFSPEMASTSKSRSPLRSQKKGQHSLSSGLTTTTTTPTSPMQQLGQLGSQQHGLYIVLHADYIHSVVTATNIRINPSLPLSKQ